MSFYIIFIRNVLSWSRYRKWERNERALLNEFKEMNLKYNLTYKSEAGHNCLRVAAYIFIKFCWCAIQLLYI